MLLALLLILAILAFVVGFSIKWLLILGVILLIAAAYEGGFGGRRRL